MKKLIITLFLCLTASISFAQIDKAKTDDKVEIVLKDGTRIKGTIRSMDASTMVIFSQSLGEISVEKSNISQILFGSSPDVSELPLDKNGFTTDFHNSTHYFGNPSAYTLKAGQKYYENIGIFFNTFSFGITNNFSLSVGGEIASLLFGSEFPVLYISPRFSIPFENETGAIGAGIIFFTSPGSNFEGVGVAQANVTLGSRNNNFTLGVGYGFTTESFVDEIIPLQISYMTRLSQKISFVTDNFVMFSDDFENVEAVFSAGVRIHFKNPGAALNLGLFRITENTDPLVAFPFVSATLPLR